MQVVIDYNAGLRELSDRALRASGTFFARLPLVARLIVGSFAIFWIPVVVLLLFGSSISVVSSAVVACVGSFLLISVTLRQRRSLDAFWASEYRQTLTIHSDYLELSGHGSWSRWAWTKADHVRCEEQLVLIYLAGNVMIPVPLTAFSTAAEYEEFRERVLQCVAVSNRHDAATTTQPNTNENRPPIRSQWPAGNGSVVDRFEALKADGARTVAPIAWVLLIPFASVAIGSARSADPSWQSLSGVAAVTGTLVLLLLIRDLAVRRSSARKHERVELHLSSDGLYAYGGDLECFTAWSQVAQIRRDGLEVTIQYQLGALGQVAAHYRLRFADVGAAEAFVAAALSLCQHCRPTSA